MPGIHLEIRRPFLAQLLLSTDVQRREHGIARALVVLHLNQTTCERDD